MMMMMIMVVIKHTVILFFHNVSKAHELLPDLVSLYFILNFLFCHIIVHAFAMFKKSIFSSLPKFQSTSLVNQWIPQYRGVFNFRKIPTVSILFHHGSLRDRDELSVGTWHAFFDDT